MQNTADRETCFLHKAHAAGPLTAAWASPAASSIAPCSDTMQQAQHVSTGYVQVSTLLVTGCMVHFHEVVAEPPVGVPSETTHGEQEGFQSTGLKS